MTIQLINHKEEKHYFPNADIYGFGGAEEIAEALRPLFEENEIALWDAFATESDIFADVMDFVGDWVNDHRGEILSDYVQSWNGSREYRNKKRSLIANQKRAVKRYRHFQDVGIIKRG